MTKKIYAAPIKAFAAFLMVISVLITGVCISSAILMVGMGCFEDSPDYADTFICYETAYEYSTYALEWYKLTQEDALNYEDSERLEYIKQYLTNSNLRAMLVISQSDGTEALAPAVERFDESAYSKEWYFSRDRHTGSPLSISVQCYLNRNLPVQDEIYFTAQLQNSLMRVRGVTFGIGIGTAILAFASWIFLMFTVGRRKDSEQIVLSGFDRIPYDAATIILFILGAILCSVAVECSYNYDPQLESLLWKLLGISLAICGVALIVLWWTITTAARIKAKTLLRNTLVWKFFSWIFHLTGKTVLAVKSSLLPERTNTEKDQKIQLDEAKEKLHGAWGGVKTFFRWIGGRFCRIGAAIAEIFRSMGIVWKGVIVSFLLLFFDLVLFVGMVDDSAFLGLLFILYNIAMVCGLCFFLIQLDRLKKGGERLAAGDLTYKIDTARMYWDLKQHAENLNSISSGMSVAVEERLKSERMKYELLTNVSHDIKTPLTSIVNYVGLLKGEHIEGEKACEYIDVLDRQAERLKKLIADLIEASKASTGNITVNAERTNVAELLRQCIGEYSERFAAMELEAVLNVPESDQYIMADGRLLWRVFDNLLGNIVKYALPHTRVYFDLEDCGGRVVISLKNISRERLNIPSNELMERFVRGDSSRSTEGSGLGLSIARSLTELMHGHLDILIDGDLFKISLFFERLD